MAAWNVAGYFVLSLAFSRGLATAPDTMIPTTYTRLRVFLSTFPVAAWRVRATTLDRARYISCHPGACRSPPLPPPDPPLTTMPAFTHQFDTALFKGTTTVNTGLFIDGKFVDSVDGATFEYVCRALPRRTAR